MVKGVQLTLVKWLTLVNRLTKKSVVDQKSIVVKKTNLYFYGLSFDLYDEMTIWLNGMIFECMILNLN